MTMRVKVDYAAYFPNATKDQIGHLEALYDLYLYWNAQINVISRKDMDNFDERHVLHSLAIAKVMTFAPGSKVLDIGTGGGFPGIPLAILFPETDFHLVDSIGKKIKVVNEVTTALGLKNVRTSHGRAENIKEQYDFVVSRAVARMNRFMPWVRGKFLSRKLNPLHNGILYLKGGDIHEELNEVNTKHLPAIHDIPKFYPQEFFETKRVVYLRMK